MIITKEILAEKLKDSLNHNLSVNELVDWAENSMMNAEIEAENHNIIRDILAHIGVADVKSFGLTPEDYEKYLEQLGYKLEYVITEL
jgi:hypothetical protein